VGSGSKGSGRDLLAAAASGQGVRVARPAAAKEVTAAGASRAGVPSVSVVMVVGVGGRFDSLCSLLTHRGEG
jgi:hypothetical protein